MKGSDCIFFQLAKANQKASRFWNKKIEHLKLTAVQAMVLNFLSQEDSITSNRLGEKAQLDSATLTGVIDRLEARDLLERKPNPHDRRAILICLTAAGRTAGKEIRKDMESANREFLSILSKDDEAQFRSFLEKVRAG
ncbi:MAG: MarR family transcriptional regulator [bacterium]|nr:MarR family transcriptional regulator [bacterium]